jgi:hypothetical protein
MAGCSRERRRCQQWMDAASERMRKGLGGVGDRPAAAAVRKAWVTRWVRGDTTCGRNRVAREQRNKRAAGRARPQSAGGIFNSVAVCIVEFSISLNIFQIDSIWFDQKTAFPCTKFSK